MCRLIIRAGGRSRSGNVRQSASAAWRRTAKLGRRPAAARRGIGRNAGLDYRIERRLATRKGEIGAPDRFQRCHRIGAGRDRRQPQCGGKALEAALGDVGEEASRSRKWR